MATAVVGLLAGKLAGVSSPITLSDDLFKWIANNGFAVVMAVLLLGLLSYVIFDAVAHFNTRLDQSALELSAGFREMAATNRETTGAISHLDRTLDKLANQSSANHEALSILLRFQSMTQQDVMVAKRTVEQTQATVETTQDRKSTRLN